MQTFINYIIRPKRNTYDPSQDLGPPVFFIDDKLQCGRMDFTVKSRRNNTLKCSIYHRNIAWDKKYPIMIYCHGNSGNMTDSFGPLYWLLKNNIFVLTFDFTGCGLSGGETISLGYFEQYDIDDVLDYILDRYDFVNPKKIGIWGRSMGAVASILYTARTNTPSLMVVDSPFSDFPTLLKENINRFSLISKLAGNYIYKSLKKDVFSQAGFNFEDLSPIKVIGQCRVPILFIHGSKDALISIDHSKRLYEAYPCLDRKAFIELKVDHNELRPESLYQAVSRFIRKTWFMETCKVAFPNPRSSAAPMQGKVLDIISPRIDDFLENMSFLKPHKNFEMKEQNLITDCDFSMLQRKEVPKTLLTKASKFPEEFNVHIMSQTMEYLDLTNPEHYLDIEHVLDWLDESKNQAPTQEVSLVLPENKEKKRLASVRIRARDYSQMDSNTENIAAEEMLDSTDFCSKDLVENFINIAATKKFESFKQKNKTPLRTHS